MANDQEVFTFRSNHADEDYSPLLNLEELANLGPEAPFATVGRADPQEVRSVHDIFEEIEREWQSLLGQSGSYRLRHSANGE